MLELAGRRSSGAKISSNEFEYKKINLPRIRMVRVAFIIIGQALKGFSNGLGLNNIEI